MAIRVKVVPVIRKNQYTPMTEKMIVQIMLAG